MSLSRSRHSSAQDEAPEVPSLVDICIDRLCRVRCRLGDVGWVEAPHLRRILAGSTRKELETIEDETLELSGRDLTWLTWDLWCVLYNSLYGAVKPGQELMPVPGEPPVDYEAPPGNLTPADYRGMILLREAEAEERKAAAVNRLRASYKQEAKQRVNKGVEFTSKLPPAKRARLNSAAAQQQAAAAAAAVSHKTLGGKSANKVLKDLGLGFGGRSAASSPHKPTGFKSSLLGGFNHTKPPSSSAAAGPKVAVLSPSAAAAAGGPRGASRGAPSGAIRSSAAGAAGRSGSSQQALNRPQQLQQKGGFSSGGSSSQQRKQPQQQQQQRPAVPGSNKHSSKAAALQALLRPG